MRLYHATFNVHLPSIKTFGLGGKQIKNWTISEDRKVYFATDPYIAESYCEVAEDVLDSIYDSRIVILYVDSSKLDRRCFCRDNNQLGESHTIAYKGVIPYEWLSIWNEKESI